MATSLRPRTPSQEGLAEVYYQRGSLLAKMRRLPEAKEQLERSLEMSRTASNDYQSIRTQLQLSNVYYAEGDSNRAKTIASKAVKAAQLVNIRTLATNGLIDLGDHMRGFLEFYAGLASGELKDYKAALRYLTARRKQAFISLISGVAVVGVAVGVMAVLIALGLMTGLQGEIRSKILGATAHVSIFRSGNEPFDNYREVVDRVRRASHVLGAAPTVYGNSIAHTPLLCCSQSTACRSS